VGNHGIISESVKIPNHVDQNWQVADPSLGDETRFESWGRRDFFPFSGPFSVTPKSGYWGGSKGALDPPLKILSKIEIL